MAVFRDKITSAKLKWRPLLVTGVAVFVVLEIVALSPSSVEQTGPAESIDQEELIEDLPKMATKAEGIPISIPDYTIDQFQYVSTQAGQKQWKLNATQAYLYNKVQLVHSRTIHAELFDTDGKITTVVGDEAKYFMNQRDLEVYGHVVTTFPDGFELKSEYMRYRPQQKKIEIPTRYEVTGGGQQSNGQLVNFRSNGLDFAMADNQVVLISNVKLEMIKSEQHKSANPGVTERTTIDSDHCVIDRNKQVAHFTMSPTRPLETRFVHINQPTMTAKSRRADMSYRDFSSMLDYMTAYEDVLIKETGKSNSLRYGTAGRADFDTRRNVIVLREFPQVYQDNDTVAGDVIVVHRDTDIVEVEHSNAFSEGQSDNSSQ
jgi:LPS export ABC transporter protein LptC